MGTVPREHFRARVREAHAYVGGARWEDFGQAPLEALADGTLLVTVPSGGPFEALRLARQLDSSLVAPAIAPDGLAAAIRTALELPEERVRAYRARALELLAPLRADAVQATVAGELVPALLAGRYDPEADPPGGRALAGGVRGADRRAILAGRQRPPAHPAAERHRSRAGGRAAAERARALVAGQRVRGPAATGCAGCGRGSGGCRGSAPARRAACARRRCDPGVLGEPEAEAGAHGQRRRERRGRSARRGRPVAHREARHHGRQVGRGNAPPAPPEPPLPEGSTGTGGGWRS